MQQFLFIALGFLASATPSQADVLTTSVADCGSKTVIGDLDLSKQKKDAVPAASSPSSKTNPSTLAIIPIESVLSGSPNAPTAYHGALSVAVPKPGPADYQGGCASVNAP